MLWAQKHLAKFDSFEEFVRHGLHRKNIQSATHFKLQSKFLTLPGKDEIEVDFVGFVENLDEDVQVVVKALGMSDEIVVPRLNSSHSGNFHLSFTDETREIVAAQYANDIRLLSYEFDNSSLPGQLGRRKMSGPTKS